MTNLKNLGLLGCGLLAAVGCKETVDGKHLDTEGIALVADVRAEGDGKSRMEISFLTGGDESNTYVDLSDDTVSASADDQKKTLTPSSKGEYDATFDVDEGDTVFSIALDRSEADKSDAKRNEGTLPDPFSVTLEASGDLSRRAPLGIRWSPSGSSDKVRVDIDGDCVFFTFEDGLAVSGEFNVAADGLIFGGDPEKDDEGSCEATVTVTRTRNGDTDEVFDPESKFRLHQVRKATFQSVP